MPRGPNRREGAGGRFGRCSAAALVRSPGTTEETRRSDLRDPGATQWYCAREEVSGIARERKPAFEEVKLPLAVSTRLDKSAVLRGPSQQKGQALNPKCSGAGAGGRGGWLQRQILS